MNPDYRRYHQNRINLVIHILAVPVFVVCLVLAVWSIVVGNILAGVLLLLGPILSIAVQGYGHKQEAVPPEPFDGATDFLKRVLSEQFFRFWAYVFSGGWFAALKSSGT